jgi:hypothetical protein
MMSNARKESLMISRTMNLKLSRGAMIQNPTSPMRTVKRNRELSGESQKTIRVEMKEDAMAMM